MKMLHPRIQQAAQRAGISAVTAAFGSDMEISHLLDEYAGLRLSVSVDGSADSITPARGLMVPLSNSVT